MRNLKNSKAQNDAEAQEEDRGHLARLKRGEDFAMLAQNYSEDPNSAPNGGDMGFIPESTWTGPIRNCGSWCCAMPAGADVTPIQDAGGYRILKVICREPAGQRELNDPRVQQNIRETLLKPQGPTLRTAYYEVARNSAKIENYLAQSIVENAETR